MLCADPGRAGHPPFAAAVSSARAAGSGAAGAGAVLALAAGQHRVRGHGKGRAARGDHRGRQERQHTLLHRRTATGEHPLVDIVAYSCPHCWGTGLTNGLHVSVSKTDPVRIGGC
jgi:hypothetical protein